MRHHILTGLHRAKRYPDWQLTPLEKRNRWQRIAARSHGILTPGNTLSLLGLILVISGLTMIKQGSVGSGATLVLVGRLMDAFDGVIADITGTKSRLGQMVDAGFDKIEAFLALAILVYVDILPLWVAVLVAIQNVANVILTLIARQRAVSLPPSRLGKVSTAGYWFAIALFIAGYFLTRNGTHLLLESTTLELAFAVAIASIILGTQATLGYTRKAFHHEVEKFSALELFDHYIIVQNPVSTDAHKTSERIRELRRLCPDGDIIVLKTMPGGRDANFHLLEQCKDKLGPRTLLGIAAGDGTMNLILDSLLHNPEISAEGHRTPILPLWCGNANDLAYMLNGRPTRTPVKKVMRRGHVVRIRPLSCTLRYPNGTSQHYTAACYASFGASAFATWQMERTLRSKSPIRRFVVSRFGQEAVAAAWALMRAPTFTISENGRTRVIFERTHLNGSRFAKVIGLPLRLTDEKFHRATIERKQLHTFMLHIIGLIGDRELAKKTITHDEFTVGDSVWAQFDGEAVHVPAGTIVDISMSEQPFYALSIKLEHK